MKYLGGKHRLGKRISDVIKERCPDTITSYLEPFCGALGVFRHMTQDYTCIASDIQPDMIDLWTAVQKGSFRPPKKITPEYYQRLKSQKKHSAMRGFAGFLCSWNGVFFRNSGV